MAEQGIPSKEGAENIDTETDQLPGEGDSQRLSEVQAPVSRCNIRGQLPPAPHTSCSTPFHTARGSFMLERHRLQTVFPNVTRPPAATARTNRACVHVWADRWQDDAHLGPKYSVDGKDMVAPDPFLQKYSDDPPSRKSSRGCFHKERKALLAAAKRNADSKKRAALKNMKQKPKQDTKRSNESSEDDSDDEVSLDEDESKFDSCVDTLRQRQLQEDLSRMSAELVYKEKPPRQKPASIKSRLRRELKHRQLSRPQPPCSVSTYSIANGSSWQSVAESVSPASSPTKQSLALEEEKIVSRSLSKQTERTSLGRETPKATLSESATKDESESKSTVTQKGTPKVEKSSKTISTEKESSGSQSKKSKAPVTGKQSPEKQKKGAKPKLSARKGEKSIQEVDPLFWSTDAPLNVMKVWGKCPDFDEFYYYLNALNEDEIQSKIAIQKQSYLSYSSALSIDKVYLDVEKVDMTEGEDTESSEPMVQNAPQNITQEEKTKMVSSDIGSDIKEEMKPAKSTPADRNSQERETRLELNSEEKQETSDTCTRDETSVNKNIDAPVIDALEECNHIQESFSLNAFDHDSQFHKLQSDPHAISKESTQRQGNVKVFPAMSVRSPFPSTNTVLMTTEELKERSSRGITLSGTHLLSKQQENLVRDSGLIVSDMDPWHISVRYAYRGFDTSDLLHDLLRRRENVYNLIKSRKLILDMNKSRLWSLARQMPVERRKTQSNPIDRAKQGKSSEVKDNKPRTLSPFDAGIDVRSRTAPSILKTTSRYTTRTSSGNVESGSKSESNVQRNIKWPFSTSAESTQTVRLDNSRVTNAYRKGMNDLSLDSSKLNDHMEMKQIGSGESDLEVGEGISIKWQPEPSKSEQTQSRSTMVIDDDEIRDDITENELFELMEVTKVFDISKLKSTYSFESMFGHRQKSVSNYAKRLSKYQHRLTKKVPKPVTKPIIKNSQHKQEPRTSTVTTETVTEPSPPPVILGKLKEFKFLHQKNHNHISRDADMMDFQLQTEDVGTEELMDYLLLATQMYVVRKETATSSDRPSVSKVSITFSRRATGWAEPGASVPSGPNAAQSRHVVAAAYRTLAS